jgi:hypothetical protein
MTSGLVVEAGDRVVQDAPSLIEYSIFVIVEPPVGPSANSNVTDWLSGVVDKITGSDGAVAGVPWFAFDDAPGPNEFTARTMMLYVVPFVSASMSKEPVSITVLSGVHEAPLSSEYS